MDAKTLYGKDYDDLLRAWQGLSAGARDTLRCLIYQGPCWDGDVPSKAGRNELLDKKLASKAVIKRQQGYQVANYLGWAVYRVGREDEFRDASALANEAIAGAQAGSKR